MMTFAELRWFWRGRCPQPVYDWFFKSGLPPGIRVLDRRQMRPRYILPLP